MWNRTLSAEEVTDLYNREYQKVVKFQVRSCNDANCDTEVFKGPTGESDYYETSAGEDLVGVADNQFFQYKAYLLTNTPGTSPELYNVMIGGHTVVIPPELSIDSAWVDWNGQNYTLNGSGLSWPLG